MDEPMTPMEDFEHQMMLSTFSLMSHSLRLLEKAGLLDDQARGLIRAHLLLLQEKIEAVRDPELRDVMLHYLDTLTSVLPPPASGSGSKGETE